MDDLDDLTDETLDQHLPEPLRQVSANYWSTLDVVRQAVGWLDAEGVGDIVDLGAGVGKWCVAAALCDASARQRRPGRRYLGLEYRSELVEVARGLAEAMGVSERVSVVHGEVAELLAPHPGVAALVDPPAYYLFNPFGENVAPADERLDTAVELTEARYHLDVARAEDLFAIARPGTWALIYNGFGGRMGSKWRPVRTDFDRPHVLRLWRKG